MENIKPAFIMTVTGPKRVGKTTFIRNLIQNYLLDLFDYIVILCPTSELNGDFEFMHEQQKTKYMIKCNGFEEHVGTIFNRQEELQKAGNAPDTLLILDDCATSPILRQNSILDKYAIRHRHAHLSLLVVGHALKGVCGLPKSLRSQIDYNIIFNPASMMELETILKESLFSDDVKRAKKEVRNVFAEKYNYLVYQPSELYENRLLVNFERPLIIPEQGMKPPATQERLCE